MLKKSKFFIIVLFLILLFLNVASSHEIIESDESNISTTINKESEYSSSTNNILKKDKISNNKKQTNEIEDISDKGEGCCSTIIQGYNNDSAISFRRDAKNTVTLNVKHNSSFVKQYKENGSYFFHVIINKNGWLVGNGGADNVNVNKAIESNAMSMINNNQISKTTMNKVYNLESKLSVGHFVIKAPNGTYSLIIKNQKGTFKDSGILKAGQYLVVPNNSKYFSKGSLKISGDSNSIITSSRMLAARDKYGISRREIVTYYYKNNNINSTVKVMATNDNGKYVNSKTAKLIDSIKTNDKSFSSKIIPILDNAIDIDFINFFIRKAKTIVTSPNILVNGGNVELNASITDEFGKNVDKGFVSFILNDKTIKDKNGKDIYVNVTNGKVSFKYSIPTIWNKLNYTYYVRYYVNSKYEQSFGNKATIIVGDLFNLNTSHSATMLYKGNLTISTKVKYNQNGSLVTGGKVFYKINGRTIRNSLNNSIIINVYDGQVIFNCNFDSRFTAKEYNLTTIYVNGNYRKEINTSFTVNKIPIDIITPKVSIQKDFVTFTGKLVDNNNQIINYKSYACIKVNGKTLKENDSTRLFNITNGIINFKFTLPGKLSLGNHTLSIVIPELRETLSLRSDYTITIV